MRGAHYTRLRGRITYFRRRLPAALAKKLASSEICIKIGVINRNDARRLGRRLAAETDSFFEDASTNAMLDTTALIRLVKQTIAQWRDSDASTAARDSVEFGLTSRLRPKDKALIHAGLADDMLEAEEAGRLLYDDAFVREKFAAAGVTPLDDPIALAQANRRLSRALALHYYETAIDTVRRLGLDRDDRDLPLQKWENQADYLRQSLGLAAHDVKAAACSAETLQNRVLWEAAAAVGGMDKAETANTGTPNTGMPIATLAIAAERHEVAGGNGPGMAPSAIPAAMPAAARPEEMRLEEMRPEEMRPAAATPTAVKSAAVRSAAVQSALEAPAAGQVLERTDGISLLEDSELGLLDRPAFRSEQSADEPLSADVGAANQACTHRPHVNATPHVPWTANPFSVEAYFADVSLQCVATRHALVARPDPAPSAASSSPTSVLADAASADFEHGQAPRRQAEYVDPACDEMASPGADEINSGVPAPLESGEPPSRSGTVNARSPFSQAFQYALDMRSDEGSIGEKQRHTTHSSLRIWLETLGDRPITDYARHDMVAYRSLLKKVPAHYWRSPSERQKTIHQIIKEADEKAKATGQPVERLGPVTINKHLSNIASFFEWAYKEHLLPETTRKFWYDLQLPKGRKATGLAANEERPAYSDEQIEKIFRHPVWTGRASTQYTKRGNVIVRDALYWAPLIAVFSLMRREEICQLKVRHVRQEDGVWIFDLWHHELDLKNVASKRYVPVHEKLLDLGLIESLVRGRNANEQLFPELKRSPSHHSFGDTVGKKFSRVIDSLGIVVMRKDGKESHGAFHPLRHYGVTMLYNAGVAVGLIDAISGHASFARELTTAKYEASERERYMKGFLVETLKAAIDKLEAPIDIAELKSRVRHCERIRRDKSKK